MSLLFLSPKRNFAQLISPFKLSPHGKNFSSKIFKIIPATTTTATTTTKKEKGGIQIKPKIKTKTKGEVEAEVLRRIPQIKKINPQGSAARLPFFIDNWAKVCSNNFILRIVAKGYKLQFVSCS